MPGDVTLTIVLQGIEKVQSQLATAGASMKKLGGGMTSVGKSLTVGLTAPIAALGTFAVKSAIDFESAFAGVRKTVDGTEAQLKKLEVGIRKMSTEIPSSAEAISQVAMAAGQLGVQTEDILSFSRVMIDLGNTTNLSAEEAATSLARFANITGFAIKDIDKLGSVIVDLGNNMATTEREIVEMSLRMAASGKIVGFMESDILALAAAMSSVGVEAQAGGSSMARVMVKLAEAIKTPGKELNTFAKVSGTSVQEFTKLFEEDAAKALAVFIEGLDRMNKSGENAFGVLSDLGLSEIRVQQALLSAAGAGNLFREAIDRGRKAQQENIALTKEAELRYKTLASQLQVLWERVRDLARTLGDALIPALLKFINESVEPLLAKLSEWIKAFSELEEGTRLIIIQVVAFAALLGPLLISLGLVLTAIGFITTALSSMAVATVVATGGIAAITAGVALLAKETKEGMNDAFKNIEDSLKGANEQTVKYIAGNEKFVVTVEQTVKWQEELNRLIKENNGDVEKATAILEAQDKQFALYRRSVQGLAQDYQTTSDALENLNETMGIKGGTSGFLPAQEDIDKAIEAFELVLEKKKIIAEYDAEYFNTYRALLKLQGTDAQLINLLIAQDVASRATEMTASMNQYVQYSTEGLLFILKSQKLSTKEMIKVSAELGKRFQADTSKSVDVWGKSEKEKAQATATFQSFVETAARGTADALKGIWRDTHTSFSDVWKNALDVFVDVLAQMVVQAVVTGAAIQVAMAAATAGISLAAGALAGLVGGKGSKGPSRMELAQQEINNKLKSFLDAIEQALIAFEEKTSNTLENLTRNLTGVSADFGSLFQLVIDFSNALNYAISLWNNWEWGDDPVHAEVAWENALRIQGEIIDSLDDLMVGVVRRYELEKEAIEDIMGLLQTQKEFVSGLDESIKQVSRALLSPEELFGVLQQDIATLEGVAATTTGQEQIDALQELERTYKELFNVAQDVFADDPEALAMWQDFVINGLEGIKESGIEAYDELIDLALADLDLTREMLFNSTGQTDLQSAMEVHLDMMADAVVESLRLLEQIARAGLDTATLNILMQKLAEQLGLIGIDIPQLAHGGIITRPTLAVMGEAGDEAVIPLDRMGEFGVGGGGLKVTNVFQGPLINDEISVVKWTRNMADSLKRELSRYA